MNLITSSFEHLIINESLCITNQAEVLQDSDVLICDNNYFARIYDIQDLKKPKFVYKDSVSVNRAVLMGKMLGLVRDAKAVSLVDVSSGKLISNLEGH
jgi:hypothetical protein